MRNENFWSNRLHKLGTPKVVPMDRRKDEWCGPIERPAFTKAIQVKTNLILHDRNAS